MLYGNLTYDDVYQDAKTPDLNYGVTNFDNIGSAFLTIF